MKKALLLFILLILLSGIVILFQFQCDVINLTSDESSATEPCFCFDIYVRPKVIYNFNLHPENVQQHIEIDASSIKDLKINEIDVSNSYNSHRITNELLENNVTSVTLSITLLDYIPNVSSPPYISATLETSNCQDFEIKGTCNVLGEDYYPWGPPCCGKLNDWYGTNSTPITITCS